MIRLTGLVPRIRIACLAFALLLPGCATPPAQQSAPDDKIVYVIGRGWHTDIALPVEDIAGPLAVLERDFPGVRVLSFGFGERQFLINRKTDVITMLAALLPSRSALLVTALRTSPEQAFGAGHVVALRVSHAGLARIEAAIWQEIERTAANEPVRLAEGPYGGSVFYGATGTYDGFHTCNTWTANVLQVGGLPVAASGVLFASQVMGAARWIRTQQAAAPNRPGGATTVVLLAGGEGLLLLNDRHPARASGSSRAIKARRIVTFLGYASSGIQPTAHSCRSIRFV